MPRPKKEKQTLFEVSERRERRYTFVSQQGDTRDKIKGVLAAGGEPVVTLWALPGGYAATTEWLKLFCRRRGFEWVISEVKR